MVYDEKTCEKLVSGQPKMLEMLCSSVRVKTKQKLYYLIYAYIAVYIVNDVNMGNHE